MRVMDQREEDGVSRCPGVVMVELDQRMVNLSLVKWSRWNRTQGT